jgi:hypothetical protein
MVHPFNHLASQAEKDGGSPHSYIYRSMQQDMPAELSLYK